MKKTVLTYGTFDLFHIGHLRLLDRLSSLGEELIVGVSTDEFNRVKGKQTIIPYKDRIEIIRNLRCVDQVIPEQDWEQKIEDIKRYNVSLLGMGSDWQGRFDDLGAHCEVVYLPRTEGVSTTELKKTLKSLDAEHIAELKQALDLISSIVDRFD